MMSGTVKNYRRGIRTAKANQVIVELKDFNSRAKAMRLQGKKAFWKTPSGKIIHGKVMSAHGNKGAVRVRFEKGLPGAIMGSKIQIK